MVAVYLVGGAVRDQLLNLPTKDRDYVVVGSSKAEMLAQDYLCVGKDFPVFLHPKTKEEYALARTERKVAPGYAGFEFCADASVTIEEDLSRRDLTINAIAQSETGELIDPYHGVQDIERRVLRHVSPAFVEDPVRILRVARFAARFAPLGFKVAEATLGLMQTMVQQGEVDALVSERVWQEFVKALGESVPTEFFQVLQACGALTKIFPELEPNIEPVQAALADAAKQTSGAQFRFALMCLPLSSEALQTLCQRLNVPTEFKTLAKRLLTHYPTLTTLDSPHGYLNLLEKLDAYRRPAHWQNFVCCLEYLHTAASIVARLQQAYAATVDVKAQPFISQGYKGAAIGEKIRQQRLQQIQQALFG